MRLSTLKAAIAIFEMRTEGKGYQCNIWLKGNGTLNGVIHAITPGMLQVYLNGDTDQLLVIEMEEIAAIGLER